MANGKKQRRPWKKKTRKYSPANRQWDFESLEGKKWITNAELRQFFDISQQTHSLWTIQGIIPPHDAPGRYKYSTFIKITENVMAKKRAAEEARTQRARMRREVKKIRPNNGAHKNDGQTRRMK